MLSRLNETIQDIKDIKTVVNNLNIEIAKQHHDLYGNGKTGLIERVEKIENENHKINKKFAYISGFFACLSFIINKYLR